MAGARERKRAERRKRKRRSDETPAPLDGDTAPRSDTTQPAPAPPAQESFQERMARRYEERNAEARAKLEPLEPGERPKAVTVGAVVAGVLAAVMTASAAVAAFGSVEVDGNEPPVLGIALFAVALWVMVWGMLRTRYWAVLGFQTLLLIALVVAALSLVAVTTVFELLASLILLAGSGTLFYFMIRAMARIQMPSPPSAD
jgi:cation transport ATPase